jgi:hypothetical protein
MNRFSTSFALKLQMTSEQFNSWYPQSPVRTENGTPHVTAMSLYDEYDDLVFDANAGYIWTAVIS